MDRTSLSPSACSRGFYPENNTCPLLLGSGIGPSSCNKLYSLWTKREAQRQFGTEHRKCVDSLVSGLSRVDRDTFHEGALSSHVANSLSQIMAQIDPTLTVVHQFYSLSKSSAHIDIAVLDGNPEGLHPHSLLEIKWAYRRIRYKRIPGNRSYCIRSNAEEK